MSVAGVFIALGAMKYIGKMNPQYAAVKQVNAYSTSPAAHRSYALANLRL
jgi:hypothetical protein